MAKSTSIAAVAGLLSNRLDQALRPGKAFAAIIGDIPSHYSKSPALWNAAFRHFHMDAIYLPFDVRAENLPDLLAVLRDCESFLGANVTVPHKVRVMDSLDRIDPEAFRIKAINTIVRAADGRLVGYNTDGEGFIQSLLQRQPDRPESFLPSLGEKPVLLLGAGGSARAVAFHVSDRLARGGRLVVCNRTPEHGESLAEEIRQGGREALAIGEDDLTTWATEAGLIINCTTKGQGGIRSLSDGRATVMEPYSALAVAAPPVFMEAEVGTPGFSEKWKVAARPSIEVNNKASMRTMRSIAPQVRFYDLIYHPEETVFLRHARLTGHPTMNGKAMIINQAVIAFCRRICAAPLTERGIELSECYRQVLEVMYRAW